MKVPWGKAVKRAAMFLVTLAVVVGSVLWLSNFFGEKIPARSEPAGVAATQRAVLPGGVELVEVRRVNVPRYRAVVGTVEAVHDTDVGSRLMARVEAVHVAAGQRVAKGQLLVKLEDEDLKARVQQAAANLDRAKARLEKARHDFEKVSRLYKTGAASQQEFRDYKSAYDAAEAEVRLAESDLKEAQTVLSWATIVSPIDGVVVDNFVEPGDMVRPGQRLVRLYNPNRMQLVASVPESLTRRLAPGENVQVQIEAISKSCVGTVAQIVPEAAARSRTFQVKVTGPCPPGVYSGMFGRLFIPVGRQQELRVLSSAVGKIGQLEQVFVLVGGRLQRRFVRLGREVGDEVVVLSGLRAGEKVAADYASVHLPAKAVS